MFRRFQLLLLLLALAPAVYAHQTSDSYLALTLRGDALLGRWSIALRDLNHVLQIDANADGEVSEEELAAGRPKIGSYSFERLKVTANSQPISPKITSFGTEEHDDAVYISLEFEAPANALTDLLVEFTLFSDTDPLHRGLFRLDLPDRTETAIFSPAQPAQRFIVAQPKPAATFSNFFREGVVHIWIGYDHILFLVALLLPSVLQYRDRQWLPAASVRQATLNILQVVTAFTIAHSLTLSLAALQLVQIHGRIVEPIIAASVFLAAINNVKPFIPLRPWVVAFAFGLIHGFGFAGVLSELGLETSSFVSTLFAFNLGVEAGQLAIVLFVMPILYAMRATRFYQRGLVPIGSAAIALLAIYWVYERVTGA